MDIDQVHEWFRQRGFNWSVGYGGGINEVKARAWWPAFPFQENCITVPGKTPSDAIERLKQELTVYERTANNTAQQNTNQGS